MLALSITFPADDPELGDELRRLGRLLPEGVVVLAGGRSAHGYADALEDIQANQITDLESLRQFLGEARRKPTAPN